MWCRLLDHDSGYEDPLFFVDLSAAAAGRENDVVGLATWNPLVPTGGASEFRQCRVHGTSVSALRRPRLCRG